ncbi:ClpP/crotonase-like domain containing protein [Rhypophila decipiens]
MKLLRAVVFLVASSATALAAEPAVSRYGKLSFRTTGNGSVTRATFFNPPINLVDKFVISDLLDFLRTLQPGPGKQTAKVVIFDSAINDWFLGHYDLHNIQLPFTDDKGVVFEQVVDCTRLMLNTTSTIFIAEINGRSLGIGQELSLHMDMRFAGPKALASSFEESIGLAAAAGGQAFLGPTIGKGRAMEYLLGAKGIDGPTGERLGLFNTYYSTAKKLKSEVSALAERISWFPQHSINDTKVTLSVLNPTTEELDAQLGRFLPLMFLPEEQATVSKFLELSGNQSESKFELDLPESSVRAARDGVYSYGY